MDRLENARALRSNKRCYVRFINSTERTVELTWINFSGQYVRYRILNKGNSVDINTYKTHPWIAKDILTKDVLHVDKNFIYLPKTTREYMRERYPGRSIPENHEARVRAHIMLPIYSLRYASLLCIRNHMLDPEDVDTLALPRNLSEELKRLIKKRNRECALQALELQNR
ncbi:von Hippel-Lindau disease tumor suppressor-like [Cylas formicarius]|uniref:von Hippel-Lindau disease tumor suppressor-like n=1 Tax=Cylas formicarius TaxID=197179 RepID=UPI002958A552|nr:von Hippel-Lindau disease tumor suppressor-like [Cylas formicarius]